MAIQCSLKIVEEQNVAILRVEGDLDFDERTTFNRAVLDLIATPTTKLVIDMSRITRISSVFIGELVTHAHAASSSSRSISVSVPSQIAKICQESGLDKVTNLIVA